ncbi:hypothetical protein TB2_009600 [Malus domestica]
MDRDREANTRCTWFTQIGYVHGVEEFLLIVKGLHEYIDVASSLEVLFLHPEMVSLTDEDAQGVPHVAELGDLPKEVTDKSIRPTQEFEGTSPSNLEQMWYLLWKYKMLKMSTREQCQVRTMPKEKTGKKHDMGYSCF